MSANTSTVPEQASEGFVDMTKQTRHKWSRAKPTAVPESEPQVPPMTQDRTLKAIRRVVEDLNALHLKLSQARATATAIKAVATGDILPDDEIELIAYGLEEFLFQQEKFVGDLIGDTQRVARSLQA